MYVCKIRKKKKVRNGRHTWTTKYLCLRNIKCNLKLWLSWTCCSCVSGYMGERCQFSDLEWWELQQAEEEKRRNVVIAACMVVLVSLLSIAACVTYCYGWEGRRRRRKEKSGKWGPRHTKLQFKNRGKSKKSEEVRKKGRENKGMGKGGANRRKTLRRVWGGKSWERN